MIDREEYDALIEDRPRKVTPEEVDYRQAPTGDPKRCGGCYHFYRRPDGFAVCELMRSEEIDKEGVDPLFRCAFFTVDGENFPLLGEE